MGIRIISGNARVSGNNYTDSRPSSQRSSSSRSSSRKRSSRSSGGSIRSSVTTRTEGSSVRVTRDAKGNVTRVSTTSGKDRSELSRSDQERYDSATQEMSSQEQTVTDSTPTMSQQREQTVPEQQSTRTPTSPAMPASESRSPSFTATGSRLQYLYTTPGFQSNIRALERSQQPVMSENVEYSDRTISLQQDVDAQRRRQETSDPGLDRVRRFSRFVTGGDAEINDLQVGYNRRSWIGKTGENVVFGLLSGPQQLGRGLAIVGEKAKLTVQGLSNEQTRSEVGREYARASTDPQLRKQFDPRTPEGASTYILAATGAAMRGSSQIVSRRASQPATTRGTYQQSTSRTSGGLRTTGRIEGTVTRGGKSTPFVRKYTGTERGASGRATIKGSTTSKGRTVSDVSRGRTYTQQFPEVKGSTGGGSFQVRTGRFGRTSTDTYQTSQYGGVQGGTTQGTSFRSYTGAASGGRLIVEQSGVIRTTPNVPGIVGRSGQASMPFSRAGGTGGTGGSGALTRPSPSIIPRTSSGATQAPQSGINPLVQAQQAASALTPRAPTGGAQTTPYTTIPPVSESPKQVSSGGYETGFAVASRPSPIPGPDFSVRSQQPTITPIRPLSDPKSDVNPLVFPGSRPSGRSRIRPSSSPQSIPSSDPFTEPTPEPTIGSPPSNPIPRPRSDDPVRPNNISYIFTRGKTTPRPPAMFGFTGPDIGLGGGGGFSFPGNRRQTKQPTAYTPSLSAAVFNIESDEVDKVAVLTGLGLRPIIKTGRRGLF